MQLVSLALKGVWVETAVQLVSLALKGVWVETAVQLVSLALKGGLGGDCGAASLISVEGGSGWRLRCS